MNKEDEAMQSFITSGYSSVSEGAAIGAAIGTAHDQAGGAHLIILGVNHVAGGWQAMVLIVMKPELKYLLEEKIAKKHHDEEEYERTRIKKDKNKKITRHQHNIEDHMLHTSLVTMSSDFEDILDEIEDTRADLIEEQDLEHDVHYHFMEEGPLRDTIESIEPYMEFNMAVLFEGPEPKPISSSTEYLWNQDLDNEPNHNHTRKRPEEDLEFNA